MNEVFRRILVVAMVTAGGFIALSALAVGATLAFGSLLEYLNYTPSEYHSRPEQVDVLKAVIGGLAIAIIPNIAIAYIAYGYFKKPDSNAD